MKKMKSSTSAMELAKSGYLSDMKEVVVPKGRDKEATLSHELLRRYESKRVKWDKRAKQCERFRLGEQWTKQQIQDLARQKKAPIVVNLINPAVEQLKSMLTANDPRFNALPLKGSDRDTARAFSDIGQYVWSRNEASVALKEAIDDYSVKGLGYLVVYWDPDYDFGKGEIRVEDVEPYNVFVDPLSKKRDFSDARHIIIRHTWTKEQIMATFSGITDKFFKNAVKNVKEDYNPGNEQETESLSDIESDSYDVLDRYSRRRQAFSHFHLGEFEMVMEAEQVPEFKGRNVYVVTELNHFTKDMQTQYMIEDDEIMQTAEMIQKYGTTFHTVIDEQGEQHIQPGPSEPGNPQVVTDTQVMLTTVSDIVKSGIMTETEFVDVVVYRVLSIGEKTYWKGYTGIRDYPIIPFCNRHKRNPYPYSDVWMAMSMQKELNVTRQHIMTHTANTASIKVAVPRGASKISEVEEKFGQAGISVIEYNPEDGGAPVYMYPPQLPSQLYESEKRFEESIYQQFGVFPWMGGGGGGHETSSGTLILDEMAQRRISSKRMDIEYALNSLGKVVVQMVQRYYTEHKTIRLLQPSGRYNEIDVNSPVYEQYSNRLMHRINDVTIGVYDLKIVSGSMLPTNRMMRMEYFIKLFSQGLIDQYETLKNIDEIDAEGVIGRMGVLNQLQGQIEDLMEQVKKLEGDLQTADREAVAARKRTEVERFKAQLATMKGKISEELNAQKNRMVADMKISADRRSQEDETTPTINTQLYNQLNQLV